MVTLIKTWDYTVTPIKVSKKQRTSKSKDKLQKKQHKAVDRTRVTSEAT